MAHFPMVVPHTMVAFAPTEAPARTKVRDSTQSSAPLGDMSAFTARGSMSLVKQACGPMNTPSSMVTPW